jgi:hypothetical protein
MRRLKSHVFLEALRGRRHVPDSTLFPSQSLRSISSAYSVARGVTQGVALIEVGMPCGASFR